MGETMLVSVCFGIGDRLGGLGYRLCEMRSEERESVRSLRFVRKAAESSFWARDSRLFLDSLDETCHIILGR